MTSGPLRRAAMSGHGFGPRPPAGLCGWGFAFLVLRRRRTAGCPRTSIWLVKWSGYSGSRSIRKASPRAAFWRSVEAYSLASGPWRSAEGRRSGRTGSQPTHSTVVDPSTVTLDGGEYPAPAVVHREVHPERRPCPRSSRVRGMGDDRPTWRISATAAAAMGSESRLFSLRVMAPGVIRLREARMRHDRPEAEPRPCGRPSPSQGEILHGRPRWPPAEPRPKPHRGLRSPFGLCWWTTAVACCRFHGPVERWNGRGEDVSRPHRPAGGRFQAETRAG